MKGGAQGKEEKWVKFVEINKFIMKSEIILMQWTNYGLWKSHYMRKARAAGDERLKSDVVVDKDGSLTIFIQF